MTDKEVQYLLATIEQKLPPFLSVDDRHDIAYEALAVILADPKKADNIGSVIKEMDRKLTGHRFQESCSLTAPRELNGEKLRPIDAVSESLYNQTPTGKNWTSKTRQEERKLKAGKKLADKIIAKHTAKIAKAEAQSKSLITKKDPKTRLRDRINARVRYNEMIRKAVARENRFGILPLKSDKFLKAIDRSKV